LSWCESTGVRYYRQGSDIEVLEPAALKQKVKESGNSQALQSSLEVCTQTPIAKEIQGTALSFANTLSIVGQHKQQIIQQQQQELKNLEFQSKQSQYQ
jgi:hypothetical protein